MTRYRKIEVGTWNDRRFRELTPQPPSARTLWLWLLCGPRTTVFPGLVIATEAVAADDIRWSISDFRSAWNEIADRGMAVADWDAGVIMLPKALMDSSGKPRETARPWSPNQFRGWAKAWPDVPECEIASNYLRILGEFAAAMDSDLIGDNAELTAAKPKKRGRPKTDTRKKSGYLDVYKEVFETQLRRLAVPVHAASRTGAEFLIVPDPVPVLKIPDQEPQISGAPRAQVGLDHIQGPGRGGARARGSVVPQAPPLTSASGPTRVEPPRPAEIVKPDPALQLRLRLRDAFIARTNAARETLATALGLRGVRPIALQGAGERELMERLRESGDPEGDLDHVLQVAVLEAKANRDVRWLSWSLAEPKSWRTKLATPLPGTRAPQNPRPEPAPVQVELTAEEREELRDLARRIAKNPQAVNNQGGE